MVSSNMRESSIIWKGEAVSKSRESAIKYKKHGNDKVFQFGTIISSRHKGTRMTQCLQYHPYQPLPHQNIFSMEFYIYFQVYFSFQFCDLSPGVKRNPFKMKYNVYNSTFLKWKTIAVSVWAKWHFPFCCCYLYLSVSSLHIFLSPISYS